MAILHEKFIDFNSKIELKGDRKDSLLRSRKSIRDKIKKWFSENQPDRLQPKFRGQGSFEMNTTVKPIVVKGKRKYDLDDGVYFIEKAGENNREKIDTWHDWVYNAVNTHTIKETKRKNTCVRVIFSDGHHIDLPIYYKKGTSQKLARRPNDWINSEPVKFTNWFNGNSNKQTKRLIRYMKAWKDFRQTTNTHLKFPSGFALTILIVNNYVKKQHDDEAFRETIRRMYNTLSTRNGFKCLRPTTPRGENIFRDYSKTRKNDFLKALKSLLDDCDRAKNDNNFQKASEYLIKNQFGDRFPKGNNRNT
ncbi:MAG: cyclic GMP-AMP synthase DncV-like nucleotidyltransferase [Bacteroidota bacterium]